MTRLRLCSILGSTPTRRIAARQEGVSGESLGNELPAFGGARVSFWIELGSGDLSNSRRRNLELTRPIAHDKP